VLVLPLDGNADGATRSRLNATVQKLERSSAPDATVTVADATFDETAAAVGCDPVAPQCAVSVRTTLGVDELVYGTVTTDPAGQTTIVIRRSSVTSNPPRETTATLAAGDPPDRVEQTLSPLFGGARAQVKEQTPPPVVPPAGPPEDHTRRNLGIVCATGGGVVFIIGLALWASESSKQDQIDTAPTKTVSDLKNLQDLEDSAQTYALVGDVMVLAGLAVGGYGGWVLYKDHKEHQQVVVTPAVTPTGPTVTIGGTW
jgi:hypothetical protein